MDELDRGIADQSQSVNRTSPIYHSSEPRDQEIPTFRQQMFMQTPHESLLQQCKNLICGNSTRPDVKKSRMVPYIKLFKYADRYDILLMVLGSIAAIVDGFTLPAMLCVQSHAINAFGVHRNDPVALAHNVSQDSLLFIYVALVSWIASYFEVKCWMYAGERQAIRIRLKYLRSVLRQDVTYFDCVMSTSDVINSISTDTMLLQDAISEKVGNSIKNLSKFIGGYAVAFSQLWKIALIMIPFTPFLLLPGILYSMAVSEFSLRMQMAYEKANAVVEQAFSTVRTVYSFVAEERVLKSYVKLLERVVNLGNKQGLTKGLAVGSNGIVFAIWAFLGWYGSLLVTRNEANGGQVLTSGFAIMTGGMALGNAVSHAKSFFDGCIAAHKIFEIIDRVPFIDIEDATGKTIEEVKGKLEFLNVNFAYPARIQAPVLKDLNLEISPGTTVALIGSSGSGKSTIISLIQRFYDPLSGEILLDGVNIRDLQLKWYRKNMGLVSQEPVLFATTIKENILYGKEHASMDEIVAAATLSNAHKFITKLPDGYDTQVGERGVQMSGGQKQCIAIARSILRNPRILLLDEATSALDTESEMAVQQALEKASVGRTTVLIAHRLSTVSSADSIVILQNGTVIEFCKHEELLQRRDQGSYSALYNLQEIVHQTESRNRNFETRANAQTKCNRNGKEVDSKLNSGKSDYRSPLFCRILALNKPKWKQGLLGLLGALGFGLVQPFYAYLIGDMVSSYYLEDYRKRVECIKIQSLIFVGLAIAFFVVNIMQHYNFGVMGEHLTMRVREKMMKKFLTFEMGWFDDNENLSGALCSRLASDANTVRSLFGDRISLFVQTVSTVLVSFIIGISTSWRLALVMTAIQPFIIQSYFLEKNLLAKFAKQEAQERQDASQIASEAVSLQRTVTSFCIQEKIVACFEATLEETRKKMSTRSFYCGMYIGIAQFILYASWALDFWYGGQLVKHGKATSVEVFKTFFVLVSTGRILAEAGTMTPDIAKGTAALEFVFKVLDRNTQIDPENQNSEKPDLIRGDVEFKDVFFAYPSRPKVMVFQNFNLKIQAGCSIALVGQSGSGKSTVIGLLERFYDPLLGKVMVDGKDIKSMHLRTLRQHIALVNQEPSLFATTIRENISYGSDDCSEDEIVQAARAANAHNFISALPSGYSTFAGESGLQLSGGQKQRIAIARAILKNPRILLLDEATSALDLKSERKVQDAINHVMVGRTTVVIAHRLSTIKGSDSIAVLQDGSILEQGSYDELIAKGPCGAYFSLVELQSPATA